MSNPACIDLVIHSENAVATRLHPSLPPNEIEELQFHWEEIKYEWDDLLEAYQEHQLPDQLPEQGGGTMGMSSSSSLLYPIEEIERWRRHRATIVERLEEIGALLDIPVNGNGGNGGGDNGNGVSGVNGNVDDSSRNSGSVGGQGGGVFRSSAIGDVGDNGTGGNVNSSIN